MKQNYRDFEIIVVDGKSTDGTVKIVSQFQKKAGQQGIVSVCISVRKQNVSYQRNVGSDHAKGSYLVFLDADVCVLPDYLEKVKAFLLKKNAKFATTYVRPDSSETLDTITTELFNIFLDILRPTPASFVMGFNIIIEAETFKKLGKFDESVVFAEDQLLAKKAWKARVKFYIIRSVRLTMSMRRLRKGSKVKMLMNSLHSLVYVTVKGPIRKELFSYPMGGDQYVIEKHTGTKTAPFFTVIIPVLNEEKVIPKLLQSLLTQRYHPFEAVVVDGKSTDDTMSILDTFKSKYKNAGISYTVKQINTPGVSRQRNEGARHARGKYLMFFDADVWLPEHYLLSLSRTIQERNVTFCTTRYRHEKKSKTVDDLFYLINKISSDLHKPIVPGFCYCIKKSIFYSAKGFDNSIRMGEDYELAHRIQKKGYEPVFLDSPILFVSPRRLETDGTLGLLSKYALVGIVVLIEGDKALRKKIVSYDMGGSAHKKGKNGTSVAVETMTLALTKLYRQLRLKEK